MTALKRLKPGTHARVKGTDVTGVVINNGFEDDSPSKLVAIRYDHPADNGVLYGSYEGQRLEPLAPKAKKRQARRSKFESELRRFVRYSLEIEEERHNEALNAYCRGLDDGMAWMINVGNNLDRG